MHKLILSFFFLLCSACSTVKTVAPSEGGLYLRTWGHKSNCKEIPRVYSGVAYDFCLLNSKTKYKNSGFDGLIGLYIFGDLVWSMMADSVVLPYTIYTQVSDGNIKLK